MAKTAQDWLTDLTNGTNQAFPNIKRSDMVDGLRARLAKPSTIDQANTSLCGAASLLYCLATEKDDVYAQYIVELFHTGVGKLGKLEVKPGEDCRKYGPSTSQGIHPVDWVGLASLRDSENDFFDYDSPSVETGGITMPGDLVGWFKDAGYSKDKEEANLVFTQGLSAIEAVRDRKRLGHTVCLFIHSNLLSDPKSGSACPNHWIVLASDVRIDASTAVVTMDVFTWGEIKTISLRVDVFRNNFYGYISASA